MVFAFCLSIASAYDCLFYQTADTDCRNFTSDDGSIISHEGGITASGYPTAGVCKATGNAAWRGFGFKLNKTGTDGGSGNIRCDMALRLDSDNAAAHIGIVMGLGNAVQDGNNPGLLRYDYINNAATWNTRLGTNLFEYVETQWVNLSFIWNESHDTMESILINGTDVDGQHNLNNGGEQVTAMGLNIQGSAAYMSYVRCYEFDETDILQNETIPEECRWDWEQVVYDINITSFMQNDTGRTLTTNPNHEVYLNITYNSTSSTTCSINDTSFTSQGYTANELYNWSWINNTYLDDDYYHVLFTCNQSGSLNGTEVGEYLIDFNIPVIDTSLNKNLLQLKNTGNNLSFTVNVTDDNLYSLVVNDSTSGTLWNITSIDQDNYELNATINTSNYTAGVKPITITVCDGHTGTSISDWDYSRTGISNVVTFNFGKNGWVKVDPNINFGDGFNVEKATDRYLFKYNTGIFFGDSVTYTISSSNYIDIIRRDEYNGWLVVPALNKWIDFNLRDANGGEVYKVSRISDNEVEVIVSGITKEDMIIFESIGDLNCVTEDYEWTLVNATESYLERHIEGSVTSYNLYVVKDNEGVNTSVHFMYNNTEQTLSKAETDYQDIYSVSITHDSVDNFTNLIPINWTISVNTNSTNITARINRTEDIYEMYIYPCAGEINTTAINFTIYDGATDTLEPNVKFAAQFTYWHEDYPSYTKSVAWGNNTLSHEWLDVCIYPWWTNITTEYLVSLTKTGFEPFSRYGFDVELNHSKQNVIGLYMQNDTVSSEISVEVVNEDDQAIEGVIVELYEYDLGTDSYTFIGSATSDENGECKLYGDLDEYLEFRVLDEDGELIYTRSKSRLADAEVVLQIITRASTNLYHLDIHNLNVTLSKDKTNKYFNLSWGNINLYTNRIFMIVSYQNFTSNETKLFDDNSTLGDGIMSYVITEDTIDRSVTYVCSIYVNHTETGELYYVTSSTLDFRKEWDVFGEESLFMSFIFVGTMCLIGIYASVTAGILLTIVGMIIMFSLGFWEVGLSGFIGLVVVLLVFFVKVRR